MGIYCRLHPNGAGLLTVLKEDICKKHIHEKIKSVFIRSIFIIFLDLFVCLLFRHTVFDHRAFISKISLFYLLPYREREAVLC